VEERVRKKPFPREFPGVHWYDSAEREAVVRVIESKSPFRYYGANFLREVDSLEHEFAAYLPRKYAQATSSCTNALTASLIALGVGPGQEVLVPGFMWVASIGAIVRCGAIPVLVEIDDTFNMDPQDLERKITKNSTVVMAIHMAGAPADMDAIMVIAKRHGLRVLEDCAQSNGASIRGRKVGTFGDIAAFSFQMNKNITAGEGGMIVTDDEELYLRANAAHDIGLPWREGMPDETSEIALWGLGARMSELTAAIIRAQLPKLEKIVSAMRASKCRIKEAIKELKGIKCRRIIDEEGDSGAFIILTLQEPQAAKIFADVLKDEGIPGANYLPEYGLHIYYNIKSLVEKRSNSPDGFPWTHPANRNLLRDYGPGALPQTDALLARSLIFSVPSCLSQEDEDDMIKIIHKAHRKALG